MDKNGFKAFVKDVVETLMHMSAEEGDVRFSRKTTPTDYEKLVVEASQRVITDTGMTCFVEYTEGGHGFPDVVFNFDGRRFGIEVKSSTNANLSDNSWTILGNSILGSTRIDVEDTHIVYIKVNKNGCFINSARYEDAIADVVVTHSPRYKINLAQDPSDSFFARSGITYEEINNAEDPIGLVTDYFRRQGETAWWIAESTPATIKTWNELNKEERDEIEATAYLLFPELIYSNSSNKYKRLAKWLVANYSVVDSSLRDRFTAGGRVNLSVDGQNFNNLPRVYETFMGITSVFTKKMQDLPKEELQKYWNGYVSENDDKNDRLQYWWSQIEHLLMEREDTQSELDFMKKLIHKI